MREIKFRAWDTREQKMIIEMQINGLILIPTGGGWSLAQSNEVKPEFQNTYDEYLYSWTDADIIDGRYVPMQYTGLEDKNKVEVYEGDICETFEGVGKVIFENGMFKWFIDENNIYDYDDLEHSENTFEVIGNIYQNPELTK